MRLVFCGTSEFSAVILESLVLNGHEITMVLTQPDRPAGRGLHLRPTAVKAKAMELNVPVMTPVTLKDPDLMDQIQSLKVEAGVVVAYGLLLPKRFLEIPPLGCLNIHASLLPRWRGAAPIHRAILAGDRMTGISIMKMDEGLDTGPVYQMVPVPIEANDTTGTLENKLLQTAVSAIEMTLCGLKKNPTYLPMPQQTAHATYAAKIDKKEAYIDWTQEAQTIDRLIRGLQPFPGAKTTFEGQILKIIEAAPLFDLLHQSYAGEIIEIKPDSLIIACGKGAIGLKVIQRANSKALEIAEFLRGFPLKVGQRLTSS